MPKIIYTIHPSIAYTSLSLHRRGGLVTISSRHRARGWVHSGEVTIPSQLIYNLLTNQWKNMYCHFSNQILVITSDQHCIFPFLFQKYIFCDVLQVSEFGRSPCLHPNL
ncbi:hypothetical protein GOODEAATRI_023536 [Goodea atripinnis]|uniref:Uncharacterized protein n=1 Tax=Goodea atripinnis TaxID=208336 RepID=A0ABV0P7A6_9TELE